MTLPIETESILERILARTIADLDERREREPVGILERRALNCPVRASLKDAIARPGTSVIAEFKRASPSRGRFAVELNPAAVAAEYAEGGAVAISVLTDQPFFQGSLADLSEVAELAHAEAPPIAVLRKDFMIDEYQILEARAAGADAVLLIVAALDQPTLRRLHQFTQKLGLDSLVEVHDEEELERAEDIGAAILGINNRNLRTFNVDLSVTEKLAARRATDALLVSESGIFSRVDVERLEAAGADAILVGESLVLAADRVATIRQLRGGPEGQ
jgi:indole-3-glycerol phosphate synthase